MFTQYTRMKIVESFLKCIFRTQFLKGGTLCRAANNDCDLPEHCSGDMGQCPTDGYKKNGTPCGLDNGFCYMGECPTLNNQCEQIWGYGEIEYYDIVVIRFDYRSQHHMML